MNFGGTLSRPAPPPKAETDSFRREAHDPRA
jgi:hypothetical protein